MGIGDKPSSSNTSRKKIDAKKTMGLAKAKEEAASAAASLPPRTVVKPAGLASWLLPPKQCKESESEKILLFKLSQKYIGQLNDEAILIEEGELKPGVYTWVIIEDPVTGEYRPYLKLSLSVQEIGTKHRDILHSICLKNRYEQCIITNYAGELEVHLDRTVTANLLSGTYMANFFEGIEKKKMLKAFKPRAIAFISEVLKKSFTFEGAPTVIIDDDMVTGKNTVDMPDPTIITKPLSNEHLYRLIYDSFVSPDDIKIYAFNNVADCDAAKGQILNPKSVKGQILKSRIPHANLLTRDNVTSMIPTYTPAAEAAAKVASEAAAEVAAKVAADRSAAPGAAMLESATPGSGAAEMGGPGSASIGGGALITRRHRLRGRTRKIKRKRTTTKKKIKRNKRSNKRKKRL